MKCDEKYMCWVINALHLGKLVVNPPKCLKFMLCNNAMAQTCRNEQLYGQHKICREINYMNIVHF